MLAQFLHFTCCGHKALLPQPAPSLYWRNWVSHSTDFQSATWGRTQPAALHSARSNSDPGFGFTAAVCGWRELEAIFILA